MTDEEKELHHHGGSFQIGLFLGGLIGAVMIYLLGTKDGKKLSEDLEEKGEDWISDLEKKLHLLEEKGTEILDEGKEIKEEITDRLNSSKDHLKEGAIREVDSTLEHIEKLQERGRNTTSSIRKRLFKNAKKK